MREYTFDLAQVRSLEAWWDQYLIVVQGPGSELFGRNRDAYSDSLSGGPGGPQAPCRFVFTNIGGVRSDELLECTIRELNLKKTQCHSSAIGQIESQIDLLRFGIGETLFNWIIDPTLGVDGIEVVVRGGA